MTLDLGTNNLFVEGKDQLPSWGEEGKGIQKIKALLKSYLELDNVSFLFGAGSSMNIGSVSIANIPKKIEDRIKTTSVDISGAPLPDTLYAEFISTIRELQKAETEKRTGTGEIEYSLETFLNYLVAQEYVLELNPAAIKLKYLPDLIRTIKQGLFELCDIEKLSNASWLTGDVKSNLDKNKSFYHEKFTKKILQRPLNLKRANIFTTNYDLAFEYAFDKLGVNFISGFSGFQKRTFKPEAFEYDLFFPGSTTQGRVQRIEKVLRYYKIHGSLTWLKETPSENNVYGISEVPIELIRGMKDFENIMIYPTTAKKSFTLDFPYSELFRQFSATISQSQSVLITYGYSFSDEHINDIIYQALTIPSFTLIIIDYNGTKTSEEIKKLKELKDPRVIILQGEQLGSFSFFVEELLPDLIEMNTYEKIAETLRKLFDNSSTTPSVTTPTPPVV
ncbi:MAG: SIR2 family protein [Ignavibacteriales bacterium]|nr:SIR2 family protein [Ignavibacteriales bacterium]